MPSWIARILALGALGAILGLTVPSEAQEARKSAFLLKHRPFWTALPYLADLSASGLDAWKSSKVISDHRIVAIHPPCYETNPLLGRYPSTGRYWGQMMGTTLALDLISLRLRHSHPHWAMALVTADTAFHVGGIVQTEQCPAHWE